MFSEKPQKQYLTVLQQTDIIAKVLKKLDIKPLSLFGHNYGGSIINEMLARKHQVQIDFCLESFTFCNVNMRINILVFKYF